MANIVLIVGDQGTGKSASVESLDPKETFIVNCSNKPLPFGGSGGQYKVGVNLFVSDSSVAILPVLDAVDKNSAIKNLVIDDSVFIMSEIYFKRASETGFGKFTAIAQAYQSILSKCKSMRPDLNVAVMMHEENEVSNGIIVGKKGRTVGKLVDDQYNPLSVVSIALFTAVTFNKDGIPEYNFITNRCMVSGVVIPAKSPKGMFDLKVPNNLDVVFKAARTYYGA